MGYMPLADVHPLHPSRSWAYINLLSLLASRYHLVSTLLGGRLPAVCADVNPPRLPKQVQTARSWCRTQEARRASNLAVVSTLGNDQACLTNICRLDNHTVTTFCSYCGA